MPCWEPALARKFLVAAEELAASLHDAAGRDRAPSSRSAAGRSDKRHSAGWGHCTCEAVSIKRVLGEQQSGAAAGKAQPDTSSLPYSSHFPDLFVVEISSSPDSQVIVPLMGPHQSLPCGGKYEVVGARAQTFLPA